MIKNILLITGALIAAVAAIYISFKLKVLLLGLKAYLTIGALIIVFLGFVILMISEWIGKRR